MHPRIADLQAVFAPLGVEERCSVRRLPAHAAHHLGRQRRRVEGGRPGRPLARDVEGPDHEQRDHHHGERPGAALRAALAPVGEEGQRDDQDAEDQRRPEDGDVLEAARDQREGREDPGEVPIGARVGLDHGRVGLLLQ